MPIYERGNSFMASVGSGANRWRESFKTREEAEKAELAELLRRKDSAYKQNLAKAAGERPKGKTLKEAFELTFRLIWKGSKSERTAEINCNQVLEAIGEDTPLDEITSAVILDARTEWEERENSGGTINRKLSYLSMMLKTAADQDPPWVGKVLKMPRAKEGSHRIRWMDEIEENIVLTKCEQLGMYDLRDYIIVAVDTGFRRGELLPFNVKDFSNGLLHLHAGATKNDDARAVPATARVTEIMGRRGPAGKIFGCFNIHSLRWQWGILKQALGLEEDAQFVVHMLRHTCASRLVQRGVPLAVVQRWMGHRNIQTTLRYAHLAPNNLLEARVALEAPAKAPVAHHKAVIEPALAAHEF